MTNTIDKRQELVEFLKEYSILKVLDSHILDGISPVFTELHFGPGQIIFQQGDPADAMYIVKSGSVEVMQGESPARIIAYVTSGECFGEMALIHETPRSATIRVPEYATVIRLPKDALAALRARFPQITAAIADLIDSRLAGTLPFQAPGLQGNLAFFDLATVIQTVVASRQDGMLILFGRSGKAVAQIIMKEGSVTHATFKHLDGDQALLELMTRNDPLDFIFERKDVSKRPVDEQLRRRPPHMLLIEGARRADELPKLMEACGWPSAVITHDEKPENWKVISDENVAVAKKIWALLAAEDCAVDAMVRKVPNDRYSILSALTEMLNKRLVTKVKGAVAVTEEEMEETIQLPQDLMQQYAKYRDQQRHKPAEVARGSAPSKVVTAVNSINAVTTNLGAILGKNEIRAYMQDALTKAADTYPHLSSLKVHPDSPTLDLRGTTPEFSSSDKTIKSLEVLMRMFLEISAANHKSSV